MVPAELIVLHFTFNANLYLEHLIIRTNLVGPREFELSGLHCIEEINPNQLLCGI